MYIWSPAREQDSKRAGADEEGTREPSAGNVEMLVLHSTKFAPQIDAFVGRKRPAEAERVVRRFRRLTPECIAFDANDAPIVCDATWMFKGLSTIEAAALVAIVSGGKCCPMTRNELQDLTVPFDCDHFRCNDEVLWKAESRKAVVDEVEPSARGETLGGPILVFAADVSYEYCAEEDVHYPVWTMRRMQSTPEAILSSMRAKWGVCQLWE